MQLQALFSLSSFLPPSNSALTQRRAGSYVIEFLAILRAIYALLLANPAGNRAQNSR
jgi:hypothetical protein